MNMKSLFYAALAGTALVAGCASTTEVTELPVDMTAHELTEEDIAGINSVSSEFESFMNTGDMDGLTALYVDDAVLHPPGGMPLEGREAIKGFFEGFPPVKDVTLDNMGIEGSGDLAYVRGRYSMTIMLPDGTEVPGSGNYIEVRQRQEDGTWMYLMDMFSQDAPPEE